MKTMFTSKSSKAIVSSLKIISDCLLVYNNCYMGTCGYINHRPPICKVRLLTVRLTSFILIYMKKPPWHTPLVIDLDKSKL